MMTGTHSLSLFLFYVIIYILFSGWANIGIGCGGGTWRGKEVWPVPSHNNEPPRNQIKRERAPSVFSTVYPVCCCLITHIADTLFEVRRERVCALVSLQLWVPRKDQHWNSLVCVYSVTDVVVTIATRAKHRHAPLLYYLLWCASKVKQLVDSFW